MSRDLEQKSEERWTHRLVPGWENDSKCDGTAIIRLGRYEKLVRCDVDHAHRELDCTGPDGRTRRLPVSFEHPHGERLARGVGARLATAAEARDRFSSEASASSTEIPAIQAKTPPEVLDRLAADLAAGRTTPTQAFEVVRSYQPKPVDPAWRHALRPPPPAAQAIAPDPVPVYPDREIAAPAPSYGVDDDLPF